MCVSNALAFCYSLLHLRDTGNRCGNWPRTSLYSEFLTLDSLNYSDPNTAPRSFTITDTSNLVNRLGALNVLKAAAPLLDRDISSTLYTETLGRQNDDFLTLSSDLLKGDLPTMAMLLGLFPVFYWANNTAAPNYEALTMESMATQYAYFPCELFHSQNWKLQVPIVENGPGTKLHFDEDDLSAILLHCYLEMFRGEDRALMRSQVQDAPISALSAVDFQRYHRGSYAVLLRYFQGMVAVDKWGSLMEKFFERIKAQKQLNAGTSYLEELSAYLHLYGVYSDFSFTLSTLIANIFTITPSHQPSGFMNWRNLPSILCVTIKVPREKLRHITDLAVRQPVSEFLYCMLQGDYWQKFSPIQMCFGTVSTQGHPHQDQFKLTIAHDQAGWTGYSDLFVSFRVSAMYLVEEYASGGVAVALKRRVASDQSWLMQALGSNLFLQMADMGNQDEVFISKNFPNSAGLPVLWARAGSRASCESVSGDVPEFETSVKAQVSKYPEFEEEATSADTRAYCSRQLSR